jgi:hypothetical protein
MQDLDDTGYEDLLPSFLMDALAAYGSDSDSDTSQTSSASKGAEDAGPIRSSQAPPKRPRSAATRDRKGFLPPPSPSSSSSMIDWSKDYLTTKQEQAYSEGMESEPSSQRLEQVAATVTENPLAGWAVHLQQQKDFHNPHFFESVAEHFGIQPMGSNMRAVKMLKYDDEWESIVPLTQREEAARANAQHFQPAATLSSFAQEQIDRALQR